VPTPTQLVEHVVELMAAEFGSVEPRAMFGGWGIYHQGLFFALVMDDALYMKTDAENLAAFEAAGLEPVVYEIEGREPVVMHYRGVPEEALDTPAVMAHWARLAYGAALRAAMRKGVKRQNSPRGSAKKPATRARSRQR